MKIIKKYIYAIEMPCTFKKTKKKKKLQHRLKDEKLNYILLETDFVNRINKLII